MNRKCMVCALYREICLTIIWNKLLISTRGFVESYLFIHLFILDR